MCHCRGALVFCDGPIFHLLAIVSDLPASGFYVVYFTFITGSTSAQVMTELVHCALSHAIVPRSPDIFDPYASPYLWNQLPSFRQPHSVHSPSGSPHSAHITSSLSPPLLSPSTTPRSFTSDIKLISFTNSFLHSHFYYFRTASADLEPVLN